MIYHMAHKNDWQAAMANNAPYHGSADDVRDGFIHFSTASQMPVSAAKHRAGQRDLLLVAFDPSALGDALRWEASREGQQFPHCYGTIDPHLAAWTTTLPWDDESNCHIFPTGFGEARA